jgi:RNA polymerase sigma factor (sigma-70 family)
MTERSRRGVVTHGGGRPDKRLMGRTKNQRKDRRGRASRYRRAAGSRQGLDEDLIQAVRVGLHSKLRRLDISETWIAAREDDLLGQGLAEYARACSRGIEIVNPGGWLVHTGFRRAIDQLRREGHEIYGEGAEAILEATPDPTAATEAQAIEHVESEQLHEAVARLSGAQRQALSLYFFEEMSTRAAAQALRISEPTFRRRRDAALQELRAELGVVPKQGEGLAIDVGLAAWLTLATGVESARASNHAHAIVEGLRASISSGIGRVRDLAVRIFASGGGEGVGGVAGGAAGRAAGVCAATLVACATTGVVGSGVGGIDLIGGHSQLAPTTTKSSAPSHVKGPIRPAAVESAPGTKGGGEATHGRAARRSQRRQETRAVRRSERKASSQFGVESETAPKAPAPEPSGSAPTPTGSAGPKGSFSGPTEAANEQFGLP